MLLAAIIWCSIFAHSGHGIAEPERGALLISSGTDQMYSQVLVKRLNDTLTLTCGSPQQAHLVKWFLPENHSALRNETDSERVSEENGRLQVFGLRSDDTGHYTCALPPYTATQYVLVQPPASSCALGAFSCDRLCVLPLYVCDGFPDCTNGEDESVHTCGTPTPCLDKLPCESGRCLSASWCWRPGAAQHSCCDLHAPIEPSRPTHNQDNRSQPDYGLIQSTIYTVTACALIFMVAVVLLVSAICKMHLKRAALREYARARTYPHQLYPPRYTHADHPIVCRDRPRSDSCIERMWRTGLASDPRYTGYAPEPEVRDTRDAVTLRLGRLRVCVPRLIARAPPSHLHELQALRSDGSDTYTLNGRTIQLLGADIECPAAPPPPYSPHPPRKSRGPPPHYVSQETLGDAREPDSASDCSEPPPNYEQPLAWVH